MNTKKKYTRQHICEALRYWRTQLRKLNESSGSESTQQNVRKLLERDDLEWRTDPSYPYPFFVIDDKCYLENAVDYSIVILRKTNGGMAGFSKWSSKPWTVSNALRWMLDNGQIKDYVVNSGGMQIISVPVPVSIDEFIEQVKTLVNCAIKNNSKYAKNYDGTDNTPVGMILDWLDEPADEEIKEKCSIFNSYKFGDDDPSNLDAVNDMIRAAERMGYDKANNSKMWYNLLKRLTAVFSNREQKYLNEFLLAASLLMDESMNEDEDLCEERAPGASVSVNISSADPASSFEQFLTAPSFVELAKTIKEGSAGSEDMKLVYNGQEAYVTSISNVARLLEKMDDDSKIEGNYGQVNAKLEDENEGTSENVVFEFF